mmetsp:Transcript_18398/g.56189  ORF Transcript_18398/g.56189 Transcript_18398/m.56189 type:complete len:363 (-) Transcript_18398:3196-4284(-)
MLHLVVVHVQVAVQVARRHALAGAARRPRQEVADLVRPDRDVVDVPHRRREREPAGVELVRRDDVRAAQGLEREVRDTGVDAHVRRRVHEPEEDHAAQRRAEHEDGVLEREDRHHEHPDDAPQLRRVAANHDDAGQEVRPEQRRRHGGHVRDQATVAEERRVAQPQDPPRADEDRHDERAHGEAAPARVRRAVRVREDLQRDDGEDHVERQERAQERAQTHGDDVLLVLRLDGRHVVLGLLPAAVRRLSVINLRRDLGGLQERRQDPPTHDAETTAHRAHHLHGLPLHGLLLEEQPVLGLGVVVVLVDEDVARARDAGPPAFPPPLQHDLPRRARCRRRQVDGRLHAVVAALAVGELVVALA